MKHFFAFFILAFALYTSSWASEKVIIPKRLSTRHAALSSPSPDSVPRGDDFNMSATTTWAGATIDMPRVNGSELPAIGSVKSQWNIPRLCPREGQSMSTAGTLQTWIGISGKQCSPKGAMMQAGIKTVLRDNGTTEASAWVSWYPAISYMDVVDFDVRPGDVVTVELLLSNTTNGVVQMYNRRTDKSVAQDVYSPDPSVGDFSVCSDGNGRAWAVLEGAFTWGKDPPDTATGADEIPVFEDVSFRTLEVTALGRIEGRGLHDDSAVLYVVADSQGVAVNVDTLGDNGFQLYTVKPCASYS